MFVNFLKKKWNHDPQFAIQKGKGADSQAQWINENGFDLKALRPWDFCFFYEIDPELTRATHILQSSIKDDIYL